MYDAHRGQLGSSEVFAADANGGNEGDSSGIAEIEFAEETGAFLLKPKKAAKSRNKPGNAESSKRGLVNNAQGAPNVPKSPSVRIRCGDPGHFVKDCPQPYRPVLGPEFSPNTMKSAMKPTGHFSESPDANEAKKSHEIDTVLTTTDSSDCATGGDCDKNEQEMYKLRDEYYRGGNGHAIHMVTEMVAYETESTNTINGHGLGRESPLILIDSGTSRAVFGRQWDEWWWFGTPKLNFARSQKQFRLGAGPTLKSLGAPVIFYSRAIFGRE